MKIGSLLVFVLLYLEAISAARILAIEPYGSKSHWQFMKAILDLLAAKHQVTAITPLPTGEIRENYTEIDASTVLPVYPVTNTLNMIEQFSSAVKMLPPIPKRSLERDICDAFLDFDPVKNILTDKNNHERYDVVLLEPFNLPCLSYVAYRLRVPEIYVIPSAMLTPMEMMIFGTEPSPAHVPHLLYHGTEITCFWHRLTNVALLAYTKFVPWLTNIRMRYHEPRRYDVPDVRHKPLLLFINTHHITEAPRPFPENMVQVGGIHLKPPKPLPDDILKFIEDSPHGVIYFSFGSVSSMSSLPKAIQQVFIEAFAHIPQRVLWKYDGEITGLSDNIMTKDWFPQRDILLHPNVKLFISHGGISGVYEAVDAGVPILGFPLFYDQPRNMGHLIDSGMALMMDLLTINKNELLENVNELINNHSFSRNAKLVSKLFNHRPISSSDMVNYWFEYVLIHNRTHHFHSKALKLTWYQYWLVDVTAFVIVILFVIVYVMFILGIKLKNYVYLQYNKPIVYENYRKINPNINIKNHKTIRKRTLGQSFIKTVNQQHVDLQLKNKP